MAVCEGLTNSCEKKRGEFFVITYKRKESEKEYVFLCIINIYVLYTPVKPFTEVYIWN